MRKILRALLTIAVTCPLLGGPAEADDNLDALKAKFKRPVSVPFPADAPYSPQVATLGKMLFFDPRLSGRQNLSCASCHSPSFGYELPVPGAIGAANVPLARKAPTVLNSAFIAPLFWDGRAKSLEEQAQGPIEAPAEMNGKFDEIVGRIHEIPEYDRWFKQLFPREGAAKATVLTAIATFERTVVSGWAPFDRWVDGEENAISAAAKRGFALFNDKAHCAACHSGWNFTDNQFHDIGIGDADIGRGAFEPANPQAQHAFKTPGLRDVALRAPYGHAGELPDLESVIAFYNSGGANTPSKSPLIQALGLSDAERADLLAFLRTLTADDLKTTLPILPD